MSKIALIDWDDVLAAGVFGDMDPDDLAEVRIGACDPDLSPFRMQMAWVASCTHQKIAWSLDQGEAFAVVGVTVAAPGIGSVGLLARSHVRFRREIAVLARRFAQDIGRFSVRAGLRRLECRCWDGHPGAGRILTLAGFQREARMAGFGPDGSEWFQQWAWTARTTGEL